jgi:hypothetical protein
MAEDYSFWQNLIRQKYNYSPMGWAANTMASKAWNAGSWIWNKINPSENKSPLATNPAVGDAAWQTQAKAVQELINRNLTQNTIPMINREWANRYGSGQRQEAISRATESANFAGSNAIAQLALQQWLGQMGLEEERAWRQAMIDMQPGWQEQVASGIGSMLPYLLLASMGG